MIVARQALACRNFSRDNSSVVRVEIIEMMSSITFELCFVSECACSCNDYINYTWKSYEHLCHRVSVRDTLDYHKWLQKMTDDDLQIKLRIEMRSYILIL